MRVSLSCQQKSLLSMNLIIIFVCITCFCLQFFNYFLIILKRYITINRDREIENITFSSDMDKRHFFKAVVVCYCKTLELKKYYLKERKQSLRKRGLD